MSLCSKPGAGWARAPVMLAALAVAWLALPARAHAAESGAAAAEEQAGGAEGEEDTGKAGAAAAPVKTLAERIPSVTRRSFVKSGRVELFPGAGLSLNDPFYDNVSVGGGLMVHATEWLAIGASGDYVLGLAADPPVAGGAAVTRPKTNRPTFAGRLEVAFSPLYGKLSLLAESVLHFDLYALVGGGVVGTEQGDPTMAGVVGIGEHLFFGKWLGLKVELRDQMFSMVVDDRPDAKKSLRHLLMATLGVCFYLPSDFEDETL